MGAAASSSSFAFDMAAQPAVRPPVMCKPLSDIQPISFDRAFGARIFTSNLPILRLPTELFPSITRYLSSRDLASLSLVDRDCRLLAALSQFKSLQLNIANSKCRFIRDCHPSVPDDSEYVRACVRRLRVVMHPESGVRRSDGPPNPISLPLSSTSGECTFACIDYFQAMGDVIEKALPNLHVLDFDIPYALPPTLLQSIFRSPVKHFRLNGTMLIDDVRTPISSGFMPLETLNLKISWPGMHDRGNAFELYGHLLRHASATLQRLELHGRGLNDHIQIPDDMPAFPHLRSLVLNRFSDNHDRLLDLFLGSNSRIHTLAIDSSTVSTKVFLRNRGYMCSLDQFCWLNCTTVDGADEILTFLSDNIHLSTFHVLHGLPTTFINNELLPLVQASFKSLTSLKLVWAAPDIAEDSLQAISSIHSLRSLWLSAGNQDVFRNTWEIDTESILSHLSPLRNLETLAFSKDTYKIDIHPLAPVFCDYYATKVLPTDVDLTRYLSSEELHRYKDAETAPYDEAISRQVKIRRVAWERWHAEQMLVFANRFAQMFVRLRWCFIGQLAFSIDPDNGKGARMAFMDSVVRNPCLRSLHKRMSLNTWQHA
ncbi:hypothetical protein CPB83DRAFT_861201 [Crepidotus variabilis]|uniref:F-box domain-containing protein n=1 Tax=Crepidotus variabilis TaxID=179855 RepID=A0A9P6E8K6_9AGAR|nr:hypothetical protein CPB83DRAFT_861201 [Crepidotus variabilis]